MSTARLVTLTAVILVLTGVSPAVAGLDIDFGANVKIDDDTDLFFSVSSRYFDRERCVVETWGARYSSDDVAVAFFLARYGDRSPDYVFSLRRKGLSWWEISVRLGVPVDVWFVPVQRDPGPPYGKAYGHWKKHKKKNHETIVLTDVDLRNLVAVKMVHEYYGVSVEVAMEWRSSGRDVGSIVAVEYRDRHGSNKPQAKSDKGQGKKEKKHGKSKS